MALVREVSTQSCFTGVADMPCRQDDDCAHLAVTACSARAARPSLYSRQSHISSFRRCSTERPAGPCHIWAVACDF